MVLMALIFFSIFTATRTRRFSGPQTRDSRLPQEIQCPSQIKSKSTAESIEENPLLDVSLSIQGAILTTMLATRNFSSNLSSFFYIFSWKQMSSFCLFQAGASSTRRATVPTSKNQPTAARQSKRTTSKVNIFLFFSRYYRDGLLFPIFFFTLFVWIFVSARSDILRPDETNKTRPLWTSVLCCLVWD